MDTRGSTSSGWRLGAGVGPVARGDNPQTAQIVVDFYIHKIDYYQRNGKPIPYAPDSVSAVVTAISSSWIWVWRRMLTLHQDWRSTTRKLEREEDRTKICSKCAWSIISSGAILYLLLQFIHSLQIYQLIIEFGLIIVLIFFRYPIVLYYMLNFLIISKFIENNSIYSKFQLIKKLLKYT